LELTIERVSKQYSGVWALRDFSLRLRPGVLGLLGPNGAGKTMLMSAPNSVNTEHVYQCRSRKTSPKPTSRPRGCKFGLDLASGLPVIQEFLESIHTSRLISTDLPSMP
jgi:ABC-type dipeptide/oligopeptide/nickel transport system ATPase subunit